MCDESHYYKPKDRDQEIAPTVDSFHLIFTPPIPIILRVFYQSFSDRIFVAVADNFAQGFIASDTVLIIVLLPQRPILPKFYIGSFGCISPVVFVSSKVGAVYVPPNLL